MKPRSPFVCALCAVVLGKVALGHGTTLAATADKQEPPLRLSEPTDVIIADLQSYIPEHMREQSIPGVAVALICDSEIVWTQGFGVANTITAEPVTPETLFEVASNTGVTLDNGINMLQVRTLLRCHPSPCLGHSNLRPNSPESLHFQVADGLHLESVENPL